LGELSHECFHVQITAQEYSPNTKPIKDLVSSQIFPTAVDAYFISNSPKIVTTIPVNILPLYISVAPLKVVNPVYNIFLNDIITISLYVD